LFAEKSAGATPNRFAGLVVRWWQSISATEMFPKAIGDGGSSGASPTTRDRCRLGSSGSSLHIGTRRGIPQKGYTGSATGRMSRGWPKVKRIGKPARRGRARNHETVARLAVREEVALRRGRNRVFLHRFIRAVRSGQLTTVLELKCSPSLRAPVPASAEC